MKRIKRKSTGHSDKITKWIWLLVSLAVALLLWYLLSINPKTARSFPNMVEVFNSIFTMIERGVFWEDIQSSLISVSLGFGFGFLLSLPVAILMAWYLPVRNIIEPWIQFVRNIPPLAYVPLVVLSAGVGRNAQVIVITIATFLIMTVTIYQGVINVDETLIKAARVLGASDKDILVNTLAKENLTLDDIDAYDMDAASIVTAIASGSVDAAATWSPSSLKILEEVEGATLLTNNLTFADTTVSLASWIATPEYAADNHDTIVKFTRALFKAMDYAADDHQEETAVLVAKQVAQDTESVYEQRGDAEWLTGKEVVEGVKDGTVKGYYELQKKNFIDAGTVEVDPDISDYVLFDIMTEAGNY